MLRRAVSCTIALGATGKGLKGWQGMHWKRSQLIVAALGAVAALVALAFVPVNASGAQKAHTFRTFAVDSSYTEPAEQVGGVGCSGLEGTQPHCQFVLHGEAKFTGTFSGDVPFDCWNDADNAVTLDGKLNYSCSDYLHVSVQGCGTGSFIIDDTDGYVDVAKTDPATGTAPAYNKWNVRPGSGTGGLVGISGAGENHWTEHWVGEVDTSQNAGTGRFTGTITCRS